MNQRVSVRAIIKKDRKVLLVQPNGQESYQLPGVILSGASEPREALQQALMSIVGHAAETLQLSDVLTYAHPDKTTDQEVIILFLTSLNRPNSKLMLGEGYERYDWKLLSEIQPDFVDAQTRIALQLGLPAAEIVGASGVDRNTTRPTQVLVYTDGGSRGNPGPSAAGFVVYGPNEELLFEGGKYLGVTTNNQAEYQAVKLGLEKAIELGARVVKFRMDSQLIVNQMLGIYQIKNRDLWPIYAHIKELIKHLDNVSFQHVRREFNKEADALVNKVLDERGH